MPGGKRSGQRIAAFLSLFSFFVVAFITVVMAMDSEHPDIMTVGTTGVRQTGTARRRLHPF